MGVKLCIGGKELEKVVVNTATAVCRIRLWVMLSIFFFPLCPFLLIGACSNFGGYKFGREEGGTRVALPAPPSAPGQQGAPGLRSAPLRPGVLTGSRAPWAASRARRWGGPHGLSWRPKAGAARAAGRQVRPRGKARVSGALPPRRGSGALGLDAVAVVAGPTRAALQSPETGEAGPAPGPGALRRVYPEKRRPEAGRGARGGPGPGTVGEVGAAMAGRAGPQTVQKRTQRDYEPVFARGLVRVCLVISTMFQKKY